MRINDFCKAVSLAVLSVCINIAQSQVVQVSPWEHSSPEVTSPAPTFTPGSNPVTYGPGGSFVRERENHGYNPRYKPDTVLFSHDNRPFIVTGLDPVATDDAYAYDLVEDPAANTIPLPRAAWMEHGYVQTLDEDGNWIVVDIEELYKNISGYEVLSDIEPYAGTFEASNKLVFDADGSIYFKAYARGYSGGYYSPLTHRLFCSINGDLEDWQNGTLPNNSYLFETIESFNSDTRATLLGTGGNQIAVVPIEKVYDSISIGSPVTVGTPATTAPRHSGLVNASVTVGNKTHVVYLDPVNLANGDEVGQYYNWYNAKTGEVGTPILIGSTLNTSFNPGYPDPHNGPVITVDSEKTLHVVLGAHGDPFKYSYSEDDGATWSTAVEITDIGTYPSLVTTPDDTLHLVFRKSDYSVDKKRLWYFRKPAGQAWQDMGALVDPSHIGYSIYYHHLTTDRIGRLFLHYSYFIMEYAAAEITEYTTKWPSEPTPVAGNEVYTSFSHDPVILMSSNGGDSWHLATTQDFVDGVTDLEAYYSFDDGVMADSSNKNRDLASGSARLNNGILGNAAEFDGLTEYLSTSFDQSEIIEKGDFSVACWAKPAAIPTGTDPFVSMVESYRSNLPAGFRFAISSGHYYAYLYAPADVDGGPYYQGIDCGTAAQDEWTHLAMTFSHSAVPNAAGNYAGELKVYVNGQSVSATADLKYQPASLTYLVLGARGVGYNMFEGLLDEVTIYSYVLNDVKVAKLAQLKCNPKAIYSEGLSRADFDENGIVNFDDLLFLTENWLVSK